MVNQIGLIIGLIAALWGGWGIPLLGQTPERSTLPYRHYGSELGLTATEVYTVARGPQGFMWVGTGSGLYRFDGHRFQGLKEADGYYSTLTELVFPFQDEFLIAIGGGPNLIHFLKDGKVVERIRFPAGFVLGRGLTFDQQDQQITTLSERGAFQFDLAHKQSREEVFGRKFNPLGRVQREAHPPLYYAANYPGVYEWAENQLTRLHPENPRLKQVFCIAPLNDQLLVWSNAGVFLTDWTLETWEPFPIPHPEMYGEVRNVFKDSRGRIWFYPDHGGLFYWEAGKVFSVINEVLSASCQVNTLFEDKEANVWVGTEGEGLLCLLHSGFRNYTVREGLNSNYITALGLDAQHRLFIGSNKGLNILDSMDQLTGSPNAVWRMENQGPVKPASLDYISDIQSSPFGMCLAKSSSGLVAGWGRSGGIRAFLFSGASLEPMPDSTIALGRWSRMNWTRFYPEFQRKKGIGLESGRINAMDFDADTLWLATGKGLFYRLLPGLEVIPVQLSPDTSLPQNCFTLERDIENRLWVGGRSGVWRQAGKGWERVPGLEGIQVRALAALSNGNMWVGSEVGLSLWADENVVTYDKTNGMVGNDVRELEWDAHRQVLWVGTTTGLTVLDPDELPQRQAPQLTLLEITDPVTGQTWKTDSLTLPYPQNSLKLVFSALHFTSSQEVDYGFRLHEEDSTWQTATGNELLLLALSPGTYQIQIRCRVPGSNWSTPKTVWAEVETPFWQRPIFGVGLIFAISLLISGVFLGRARFVRNRESEKRKYLKEIHHLEQSVINASLNPHFVFNALNSIQSFFLKYKDHPGIRFTSRLARLIRLNMDLAHQKRIPLQVELNRLELYLELEKTRLKDVLNYTFVIDPELEPETLMLPNMILQPIVENAIWHGIAPAKRPGKIEIHIGWEIPGKLVIIILDDGVGLGAKMPTDSRFAHDSKGLRLIRERIRFYHPQNRLQLAEREGQAGTCAKFELQMTHPPDPA